AINNYFPYTRRRLRGRQPLCGVGVVSVIPVTSILAFLKARMAASRPIPGPFTKISTFCKPASFARVVTWSTAVAAAKGVDFREPLKPADPDEPQANTLPCSSVIEIIVLLNVAEINT